MIYDSCTTGLTAIIGQELALTGCWVDSEGSNRMLGWFMSVIARWASCIYHHFAVDVEMTKSSVQTCRNLTQDNPLDTMVFRSLRPNRICSECQLHKNKSAIDNELGDLGA